MTIRRRAATALTAAALLTAFAAQADIVDTTGMEPWEVCGLCHGYTGVSHMAKFPKLAGQPAAYLENQIRAFQSGARSNDGGQMGAIATEVAAEDIEKVAAWFAGQEPPPPGEPADDPALAARGAEIFQRGLSGESGVAPACRSCHADQNPDLAAQGLAAPWLSAQHASYLEKQLEDFASGAREGGPMPTIAAALSAEDRQAVAAYLAASARGVPEAETP